MERSCGRLACRERSAHPRSTATKTSTFQIMTESPLSSKRLENPINKSRQTLWGMKRTPVSRCPTRKSSPGSLILPKDDKRNFIASARQLKKQAPEPTQNSCVYLTGQALNCQTWVQIVHVNPAVSPKATSQISETRTRCMRGRRPFLTEPKAVNLEVSSAMG